jgi:capsular polysaccharide transport system ATP-binding protein
MIVLDRVTANINLRNKHPAPVLSQVDLVIPSDRRIALLGASRPEAQTLINMFGGLAYPTDGQIVRKASVSFPIGYFGGFVPDVPTRVNIAHLARIYELDIKTIVDFVEQSVRPNPDFDRPFGDLPRNIQRRIATIVAYTLPFDVYVLMQDAVHGKPHPKNVALSLFEHRNRTSGMIISVTEPKFALDYCDMAMVLDRGQLIMCEDVESGLALSKELMEAKAEHLAQVREERRQMAELRRAERQEARAERAAEDEQDAIEERPEEREDRPERGERPDRAERQQRREERRLRRLKRKQEA